jgi:hypothetical protein
MVYEKSDVDNELYLVRDREDKKQAANLLANIKNNIFVLTDYMYEKIQNKENLTQEYKENIPYIKQLKKNIKNVVIRESSQNSVYTSYTVNKGDSIVFCIRSKSINKYLKNSNLHNLNLVMYVALHEISHVACPEYNHTPLFKRIFNFIATEAVNIGIYRKIEFETNPKEYCGMTITDSII